MSYIVSTIPIVRGATVLPTLQHYAQEVADLTNGKIVFLGPHFGIVTTASGVEIDLVGPAVRGWRKWNVRRIQKLRHKLHN